MSRPIGIGFVGGGPVTQAIHLPAIATLSGQFRTVRVMDVNRLVAETAAARYGAIASTEAEPVFADPAVEVVAICSPNAFHAEQVIAACQAGKKAVLCEKPLAVSKGEAARIKAASEASGTAIFVGTMHAYDPAYRAAFAAWQASGDTALQVRNAIFLPSNDEFTNRATELVPVPAMERGAPSTDAAFRKLMLRNAMLGLSIHDVPLVRDFQPIMGRLLLARYLPPFGYALLAEHNGCTAELTALMPGRWPAKWTFEATGRTHRLRASMPPSYVMAGSAVVELEGPDSSQVFHFTQNGYQALWQAVNDTVRNGAASPIPLDTAIADLAFALDLADGIDQILDAA